MNWDKFGNIAQLLHRPVQKGVVTISVVGIEEAIERTIVNRIYFNVFCTTRDYAERKLKFVVTRKAEDHERLRMHLTTLTYINMASILDDLRKWRNKCDYDHNIRGLKQMVIDSFIALSDALLKISTSKLD